MTTEPTASATAECRGTVLVTEDEAELREVYRRLLGAAGYRVLAAANGRQACQLLGKETVHLVLTDLLMPEMDGAELIRWMRREGMRQPVLMVSGANTVFKTDFLAVVRELGATATLEKPVTGELLLAAVARLLNPTALSTAA